VKIWPVLPELAPYDIGLFTLQKNLKNPMVSAFWELMAERRT